MNEKVEQSGSTSPDSKSILTSSSDTNRALATRDDEGYSKKESGSNVTSSPEPQSPSPRPLSSSDPDVEHAAPPGPPMEKGAEENFKPKTLKFWLIMMSTIFSMFLVALDRTIISTAIPQITDDFKSLGDIGWYGSGYMLTTAAFQLVFGRIYRFYDLRWTFLCCIIVFEIGSAICGAAPTSPVFIFGRAIAGIGSAGIFTGAMMVIMAMVPLHKRPMFQCMPQPSFLSVAISTNIICSTVWPYVWCCVGRRTSSWRSFHRAYYLEVVLLHQPSRWWSCFLLPFLLLEVSQKATVARHDHGTYHATRSPRYLLLHSVYFMSCSCTTVGGLTVPLEQLENHCAVRILRVGCLGFCCCADKDAENGILACTRDYTALHSCRNVVHGLPFGSYDALRLLFTTVV